MHCNFELPLVKRVNFNSQGVKPLVLCVQHIFINTKCHHQIPLLWIVNVKFKVMWKDVCVCLEVVTTVKVGIVSIVVNLELWFRSAKLLNWVVCVLCLDCEQSYIELHGQCFKILRKDTVEEETMNVSNLEEVKDEIYPILLLWKE